MSGPSVKLGKAIITTVDPRINNGVSEAMGFVTNVLSEEGDDETRVNIRIVLDTGEDIRRGNVLFLTRAQAEKKDDDDNTDASGTKLACWPA